MQSVSYTHLYVSQEPYGIFVFHDRYDVPVKGTDKERQVESEEVFEYIITFADGFGRFFVPHKKYDYKKQYANKNDSE